VTRQREPKRSTFHTGLALPALTNATRCPTQRETSFLRTWEGTKVHAFSPFSLITRYFSTQLQLLSLPLPLPLPPSHLLRISSLFTSRTEATRRFVPTRQLNYVLHHGLRGDPKYIIIYRSGRDFPKVNRYSAYQVEPKKAESFEKTHSRISSTVGPAQADCLAQVLYTLDAIRDSLPLTLRLLLDGRYQGAGRGCHHGIFLSRPGSEAPCSY
jgi:hypothetical protein